jgi:hypothetical protein
MNANSAARALRAARALGLVGLATLAAGCVFGNLRANPGYASFGSRDIADTNRDLALSLGPLPLKIARFMTNDDPELVTLLHDVKAVRVYTYEVDGDAARVKEHMQAVRDRLVRQGWYQIVAVRDDGELVDALLKMDGSASIRGLAVIVQDHEDLTLVNVIGRIQPETFGALMAELHVGVPRVTLASLSSEPRAVEDGAAAQSR